jgi:hypothetical protein
MVLFNGFLLSIYEHMKRMWIFHQSLWLQLKQKFKQIFGRKLDVNIKFKLSLVCNIFFCDKFSSLGDKKIEPTLHAKFFFLERNDPKTSPYFEENQFEIIIGFSHVTKI